MLTLENTHNRGGGRIQPFDSMRAVCSWAHQQGLATHLDGARLLNAVVASGIPAEAWAQPFDTVSVCFSKGLGAPVGSALCGPKDLVREARRHRKALGGGMRQVGILAAGALYALEHHVDRLAEDHANARRLGKAVDAIDGLRLATPDVPTNMVFIEVEGDRKAADLVRRLGQNGLLVLAESPTHIRAVMHLDVTADDVDRAVTILRQTVE